MIYAGVAHQLSIIVSNWREGIEYIHPWPIMKTDPSLPCITTHFFCYHFEAWTKWMVVILKTATANAVCEMASLIFCFKLPWKLFLGVKLVWNWLGAVYATNNTLNKWHIQCKSVTLDRDGSYNAQGLPWDQKDMLAAYFSFPCVWSPYSNSKIMNTSSPLSTYRATRVLDSARRNSIHFSWD